MEEKILEILERNFTDSIEFDRNKAAEELLLLHSVVFSEAEVCPDCHGLGYHVNGIYTPACSTCNGDGQT